MGAKRDEGYRDDTFCGVESVMRTCPSKGREKWGMKDDDPRTTGDARGGGGEKGECEKRLIYCAEYKELRERHEF